MFKTTRISMSMLGATLAGALLLGATPALAGDATEDSVVFDEETEQPRPLAPANADEPRPATSQDSFGGGGGAPSRAHARDDNRAKQDGFKEGSDEHEFQQQIWTTP